MSVRHSEQQNLQSQASAQLETITDTYQSWIRSRPKSWACGRAVCWRVGRTQGWLVGSW